MGRRTNRGNIQQATAPRRAAIPPGTAGAGRGPFHAGRVRRRESLVSYVPIGTNLTI